MSADAQVKCPYVGEDYKCIIFERDVKAVSLLVNCMTHLGVKFLVSFTMFGYMIK